MQRARIEAIEYHLPKMQITNEQLAADNPELPAERIEAKIGIRTRHIASENECASDLAVAAARKLFASGACTPKDVDFILLCTQSPDYLLPTTACLLQDRLGIPTAAGALDFNLGCSGYIYGLGLAKGLIETGQAAKVLLITAETYSKHIHPGDRSVRSIFGDAAAATLISTVQGEGEYVGPLVFGTDGSGAKNLIVQTGGMRKKQEPDAPVIEDEQGCLRTVNNIYMNGPEIFNFTLKIVPNIVNRILVRAALSLDQVDLFVFHQANKFMLEYLRKKMAISPDKFVISMQSTGNTVSATIPIALKNSLISSQLQPGQRVMLVGFGVGYSWGAAMVRW